MGSAKNALKELRRLEEEILRDDNVLLAYVFGSCAHGFITLFIPLIYERALQTTDA